MLGFSTTHSFSRPLYFFLPLLLWLAFVIDVHGAADEAAARIISIYGDGDYRLDETRNWQDAQVEQELFGGNYVRTGSYSKMGMLFADRTQIRLSAKSILRIKGVGDRDGRSATSLRLERGRAWTRTKVRPKGLRMETPSATAAIRGTDWDLFVAADGSSVLTVLSGEVEFFNELGSVTVIPGEQASAQIGKAPVKRLIVQPEDRVQWVSAYRVEPLRAINLDGLPGPIERGFARLRDGDTEEAAGHFGSVVPTSDAERESLELGLAALSILRQDLSAAHARLRRLIAGRVEQPAAYLILSDLHLFSGETDAAVDTVQAGLARFPENPRLYSQLARVYLVSGEGNESTRYAEKALEIDPDSLEGNVALGDAARIEGRVETARAAYTRAVAVDPVDSRGWFGLGVINTEREEVRDGRTNLHRAIELDPEGAGYQGELGTLKTFANDFPSADQAFDQALGQTPDDYVALVGQGILELKRGNRSQALERFLRAQTIEPRYARGHMYAAVAHYQMGRHQQALDELALASRLDDKDPLPYFMASIIHTDLLQPAEAVQASRKAMELLPYLKSLNQLATDQRGRSNLGQAYAFWGLEEWARSFAQESYLPTWGGSHLFLADRYDGLFNKNSELFQGLLADPLAFGASNRFSTLITSPGGYFSGSLRGTHGSNLDGFSPMVELSGLSTSSRPLAYYLAYENHDLELADGPYDQESVTGALGYQASHALGMFLFADRTKTDSEIRGSDPDRNLVDELITERVDLGVHYKFAPDSQLWLKGSRFDSEDQIGGELLGLPVTSEVDVEQREFALRHTFSVADTHEISWGVETGERETGSLFDEQNPLIVDSGQPYPYDQGFLDLATDYRYSEQYLDLYLSDRIRVNDSLLLQVDLVYQDQDRYADYITLLNQYVGNTTAGVDPLFLGSSVFDQRHQDLSRSQLNPRLGLVYKWAPERLLRLAYQDWLRPRGFSTLGSVATAGIPLDDRMVPAGGELERLRGQLEWGFDHATFATAYLDYEEIESNPFALTPFQLNENDTLQKLRHRDLGSLARSDMLEFVNTPDYESGRIMTGGLSLNRILNRNWSLYGRYIYRDSQNTGRNYNGAQLPYLPDHTLAGGATYVDPDGWYFTSRLVYRTERFTDEANTQPLEAGFDGAFDLFWQSQQKEWLLRFSVDQAFHPDLDTQYTAEVNLRL